MKRFTSSEEVINYLRNNIRERDIFSVFFAGSFPEKLIPESDLDIFVIILRDRKNNFFDNLKEAMDRFVEKNNRVAYTFFRGPMKCKTKGLIHFLIYTGDKNFNSEDKEHINHESRKVLLKFKKDSTTILGEPFYRFLRKLNLEERKPEEDKNKYVKKRYFLLKQEGYVEYPEWRKIKKSWQLVKSKKRPNKYFKDYLLKYYEKNLK